VTGAAGIAGKGSVGAFQHAGADALARISSRPKCEMRPTLDAGAILPQAVAGLRPPNGCCASRPCPMKSMTNKPCEVAQTELARDFLGRLHVGLSAVSSIWCSRVARRN